LSGVGEPALNWICIEEENVFPARLTLFHPRAGLARPFSHSTPNCCPSPPAVRGGVGCDKADRQLQNFVIRPVAHEQDATSEDFPEPACSAGSGTSHSSDRYTVSRAKHCRLDRIGALKELHHDLAGLAYI
jgi:hypothetical protein